MIFNQKKVALICPALHIGFVEQKEYIDKFDVVVRVNNSLPLPKDIQECTGSRCDVLYVAQGTNPNESWDSLKEVRISNGVLWNPCKKRKDGSFVFNREKFSKYKNIVKVCSPHGFYKFITEHDSVPNIGIQAVLDIMEEEPALLYITGMTFFQTGYYSAYENPNKKAILSNLGDMWKHNQKDQMHYFRKFYLANRNKIKIDNELASIIFINP